MKQSISKAVANLALSVTKANVNQSCVFIIHQPKLPKNSYKLKQK